MITVIEPRYYWPVTTIQMFPLVMEHVERCARVCYKSEDRITPDSATRFVKTICKSGHESVLEHMSFTAIVVCSRACSHQLVRHRIAAYSQESMRYVNYGKRGLQVICPPSIGLLPGDYECNSFTIRQPATAGNITAQQERWIRRIDGAYDEYKLELAEGVKPEDARYVLPNAVKTELAVTFNLRQWRHVFKERALNQHAQWEIRGIFSAILVDLKRRFSVIFGDLV